MGFLTQIRQEYPNDNYPYRFVVVGSGQMRKYSTIWPIGKFFLYGQVLEDLLMEAGFDLNEDGYNNLYLVYQKVN